MKRILLAVSGMNPQVITETLFALHQTRRRVDAVHVLTTRRGKERIHASLLPPLDGQYHRYLREYGIDPESISFGFENVHAVTDTRGVEIDDISGEEDSERFLRLCMGMTFECTADPATAVFFSLAGGRKTMSACLMAAAQFYARPQDRVYHVLVTPEFESNRDFFYPPKVSVPLELHDAEGRPYVRESRFARITLVSLPFVSVRKRLTAPLLASPADPGTLLADLVREEQAMLTVDMNGARISYRSQEMDMTPARFALYAFFALQKKECQREPADCRSCSACFLSLEEIFTRRNRIAECYRKIASGREFTEMSDTGILDLNAENFHSYKAKIRKDLERGFGLYALSEIAIDAEGDRPDTRYGLRIGRERLRVVL